MENSDLPPQGLNAPQRAAQEQNITPWSVTGDIGEDGKVKPINYNKLVE
jgi:tryptophanyl-tRNA synthetase